MTRIKYRIPVTLLKYRRFWRFAIRPIVPGIHHQLYTNELVNSSLAWDSFQVTLVELVRTKMAIFMRFYSKMVILKNGAKTNMIKMVPIHAYPPVTLYLVL